MSEFNLDHEREARLGFDEAIFCAGKERTDERLEFIERRSFGE